MYAVDSCGHRYGWSVHIIFLDESLIADFGIHKEDRGSLDSGRSNIPFRPTQSRSRSLCQIAVGGTALLRRECRSAPSCRCLNERCAEVDKNASSTKTRRGGPLMTKTGNDQGPFFGSRSFRIVRALWAARPVRLTVSCRKSTLLQWISEE